MKPEDVAFVVISSLLLSLIVVRFQISEFRKRGFVATDYYKRDLRKVPTCGGISLLIVFFTILAVMVALGRISRFELIASMTILLFGVFGLLDDFIDVGRITKVFIPLFFSIPVALEMNSTSVILPLLGEVDLGLLYVYLIVPLYVMVVANLVNMHSGFNGLAVGLSAILMFFLLVKSIIFNRNLTFTLSCMLGAVLGLLYYNWYPSRIFDGNVGAMTMGATIGLGIVACGFLVSGFVMLIPHTVNFLMYVYWRIMRKLHPDDERWKLVKFGRVREDGTLEVPNRLTLKWLLPYHFRMTEKQVVLAMYALTIVFCLISLPIPY